MSLGSHSVFIPAEFAQSWECWSHLCGLLANVGCKRLGVCNSSVCVFHRIPKKGLAVSPRRDLLISSLTRFSAA